MSTLGIIGTAGRGPDGVQLEDNPGYWRTMRAVAQVMVTVLKPDRLVSGGAAYSDHIAVQLYLEGAAPHLTLHLPAEWMGHGFRELGGGNASYDPGRTSNWYHSLFSGVIAVDTLGEIQQAIERGADVRTGAGGFKARNTDIANEADIMLAFTFGEGAQLKDGGTADTMHKYLGRRGQTRDGYCTFDAVAYHYCLNTRKLFSL